LGKVGSIPLRAYRLDEDFLRLYKSKQLSTKALIEKNFGVRPIFNELTIEAKNSLLIGSFISAVGGSALNSVFGDRDDSSLEKAMAKNLDFLYESVDDLSVNMSRLFGYSRAQMKQQQIISSLRQRKVRNSSIHIHPSIQSIHNTLGIVNDNHHMIMIII
jgi:hypothetical protein